MIRDLSTEPYWTEADAAELDLLTHELVRVYFEHLAGCSVCGQSAGSAACEPLREAIACVVEWRGGRILRSKAAYLRELESAPKWQNLGLSAGSPNQTRGDLMGPERSEGSLRSTPDTNPEPRALSRIQSSRAPDREARGAPAPGPAAVPPAAHRANARGAPPKV